MAFGTRWQQFILQALTTGASCSDKAIIIILTFYVCGEEKQFTGYVTDPVTDLPLEWLDSLDKDRPFLPNVSSLAAPTGLGSQQKNTRNSMRTGRFQSRKPF